VEEFTRVGQIVGAFGLKGQVKILPMTEILERFEKGSRLRLNGEWVEVETFSVHKGRPLVKFRGIDDVSAAETLQWAFVEAPLLERHEMDEDEYFTADLIGLKVTTVEGKALGVIDDVLPMPAHDVIKIGDLLIPAVAEFVKEVDLGKGTMTVKLIPGMIE
jgi:16S rRNA processing protein RimM